MSVFGKKFTFNGTSSDKYNLVMCAIDSVDITRETALNLTLNKGELNPYRDTPNLYSSQYADVLKFDMTILKCDTSLISPAEEREIIDWLTSPLSYSLLTIDDDDTSNGYHEDVEYFVKAINISEIVPQGDVTGLTVSFECNAPYGFSPLQTTAFSSTSSTTISIENISDELYKDYYPTIFLKAGATGTVTFKNNKYPDQIMEVKVNNAQQLTIDCQNGDIDDNTGLFDYETGTNLVWLRLAHGINQITITGNCTGEFRCRYIRKVSI